MNDVRHLAIFIRSLGGGGGAERMMVVLAGELASRGHRVDLVLGRVEGNFVASIPPAVRLVGLGGARVGATLRMLSRAPALARDLWPALASHNPPRILGCAPALVRYLREERPETMLTALNYTSITALLAREISGVSTRLVVSERNTLSRRSAGGSGSVRALPRIVQRFYPKADALAAVSQGVARDLAALLGLPLERIAVTYNPVVTPEIAALAADPLDDPWFAAGAPPVVLAAGKLKRQKDFPTLLKAFAKLRARRDLRLMILGEGPQRRRLEAQVRALGLEQSVRLPGFRNNVFAYMARSRLFVLSSAWEGLPGVLIQALACGCPVVSTDCPSGPSEILEGGRHGPLVPVGDAEALAAAMEQGLDRPPDRTARIARAQDFTAAKSTDRYLRLLLGDPTPCAVLPD